MPHDQYVLEFEPDDEIVNAKLKMENDKDKDKENDNDNGSGTGRTL